MESEIKITSRCESLVGVVKWRVVEFNHGETYMLVADSSRTQFQAHFGAEEWAELQRLIAGRVEA